MRTTGTVKWFDNARGLGFLTPNNGGPDCFVHFSDIIGTGRKTLVEGANVEFDVIDRGKGPAATNVTPLEPSPYSEGSAA
jgi:CspA family cold shock protein